MHELYEIEVLMAVCNSVHYIEEQIYSIYNQTLKPVRLIISDDSSEDGSIALLKDLELRYKGWLQLLPQTRKLGCSANFGRLMEYSKSNYIALADQDDLWDPDKLEECFLACLEQEKLYTSKTPILVHSDLRVINSRRKIIASSYFEFQSLQSDRNSVDDLIMQNIVTGCSTFLNRSLLNIVLPLPKENIMHDAWLGLVASKKGIIYFLPKPLLSYRQHNTNLIGAYGSGYKYFFSRLLDLIQNKLISKVRLSYLKAKIFHDRFGGDEPLILIYQKSNIFTRLSFLIHFRMRKHGFLRNFGLLLIMIFYINIDLELSK